MVKLKWHEIDTWMHAHYISDNVRVVRQPAGNRTGYVYRNQVHAHGEWHDMRGTYTTENRATDEARKHDAQLKRELKGWGR